MPIKNLSELLLQAARNPSNHGILFYRPGTDGNIYDRITYSELLEHAEANASLIHELAPNPDTIILLHFDNHYQSIIWFWSVVIAGYLPVVSTPFTVDLDQRKKHLLHLQTLLQSPLFLTSERLLGEFCDLKTLNIKAVENSRTSVPHPAKITNGTLKHRGYDKNRDDVAALMLTSGSTGHAKAVMLRHGQMLQAIHGKSEYHETTHKDVFLNWISLDHVANLTEIHLHAMNLAAEQVHVHAVDLLNDPLFFLEIISKHHVAYTFAPNFFLASLRRAIEDQNDFGLQPGPDLSSLRALISGGEANVVETCKALSKLISNYGATTDCIRPGFGMTETCAGSIYSKACPSYDLARELEFASLGRCIPGINMRVVSPEGDVLTTNLIGLLEVSGEIVFQGYYNNTSATVESFSKDGWFRTGDLALIDASANLNMAGRAKESIIINGVKYYPQELETALHEANIPGLTPSYTAVFAHRPRNSPTEVVCIVYLPTYRAEDIVSRVYTTDAVSKVTMTYCGVRPYKIIPLEGIHLPKTSLGKLSRAKLLKAFEEGKYVESEKVNEEAIIAYRKSLYRAPSNKREERIMEVFGAYFEIPQDFGIDGNVFEAGVTSVELLRLKSGIEKTLELTKQLPIATLMTNPTARTLAQAVEKLQGSGYDPIAVLQPHGAKTPLWLVHPGVGEIMIFMQLAQHLNDRPVYALRAKGLDGEEVFKDFSEAVHSYHAAIRRKQPSGPYAIAGYSYGSNIAFEITKIIESKGDTVKFLGVFDQPPQLSARSQQFDWIECLLFISFFLGLVTEHQAKVVLGPLLRKMPKQDALTYVITHAPKGRMGKLAMTRKKISDWADVAYGLKVIGRDYNPSGTVATLDCFYAQPLPEVAKTNEEWFEQHLEEWESYVRGNVGFYPVKGTHYDMITTHVMTFQKKLKKVLQERGV